MAGAFSCHSDVVVEVVNFLLPIDCESVHQVARSWRDVVKRRFLSLDGICELFEAMSQIFPEELRGRELEEEGLGVLCRRSILFATRWGSDGSFADMLDAWLRRRFGRSLAAITEDKIAMAELSGPLLQELLAVENNHEFPLLPAVPSMECVENEEYSDGRFVWDVLSNSEEVASFMKGNYQCAMRLSTLAQRFIERHQKLRSFWSLCGQMMQELVRAYTLSMPTLCYESDMPLPLTCFVFRPVLWERKAVRAKTRLYGKGPVNRCELAMDRRLWEHVSNAVESIFRDRLHCHDVIQNIHPLRINSVAEELSDRDKLKLDEVLQFGSSRPAWRV